MGDGLLHALVAVQSVRDGEPSLFQVTPPLDA